ncbi:V-type ATPase subunit [Parasphaerochaeta coccoides]|uniref:H+transporting two-sector ATPase C (AC39) subunit n=1 Tax=Parasphaerochaeta coccoides (strain ATCC BAA-1237 / DSM 17374 / SPN1) TaxID=760011 RepID=F4GH88_PARC1|nr:V-type ATPase subunit [Parasphaerochaeta coccoides]AEC01987.1 H+transporting two-sector ATPase C (AC39) subunit [Parasphaerochaeta coccoides DSM 17374]
MKSVVARYGYINARLRAKIGAFKENSLLPGMLRAETLVEAIQTLKNSRYADLVRIYDQTGDIQQVELGMLKDAIMDYHMVIDALDGVPQEIVRHLMGKLELENLKSVLRLWYSNIIRHHSIASRGVYVFTDTIRYPVKWSDIINAVNWEDVLYALHDTPYRDVLAAFDEHEIEQKGLFPVETALDKDWYEELIPLIHRLTGLDRTTAHDIYTMEIDFFNILALIRYGWYYSLPSAELEHGLIPYGHVASSPRTRQYLDMPVGDRNPEVLLNDRFPELAKATGMVTELTSPLHEDGDVGDTGGRKSRAIAAQTLRIERNLLELRRKKFTHILSDYPFTLGVVMAYFFLHKREVTAIRAVLNGKFYGWSEAQMREVLV